ncbi:MAG: hypothetical protein IJR85_06650 [Synergistaceae bacterium]|nr:hypothetical protein [Synergistaceae bacterium]
MIETLLDAELFPLKDSYVPFLRYDRTAIVRNPKTVNRIAGTLYQMGPLFKRWIAEGVIGVPVLRKPEEFLCRDENCILNSSDGAMQKFAAEFLGFRRNKGVDFLAKFSGKYIAGEAKFLTDFGGIKERCTNT